jgi:hypothetical protein
MQSYNRKKGTMYQNVMPFCFSYDAGGQFTDFIEPVLHF